MVDMIPSRTGETLQSLNRRVEALEVRESNLRRDLTAGKRALRRARLAHLYRLFQYQIRIPTEKYQLWPLGTTAVGPLLVALLMVICVHALTGSYVLAAVCGLTLAALAAAVLAHTLYGIDNRRLAIALEETHAQLEDLRRARADTQATHTEARRLLAETLERRETLRTALQHSQMRLLQQNWRAMRGPEWERFLGSVFTVLGATVRHTGKSGDQGVDLIVEIGTRRYAVQAKGYVSAVGNGAVQQAVAGMALYKCNSSAVITNSRFTPAAIELAKHNGCILIGEQQIPALVMGKLPL